MLRTRSFFLWALVTFALCSTAFAAPPYEEVDFGTAGGIKAHADLYSPSSPSASLIILFHQAGWSRGEYREIAPKLVALGYKVMAVDQRSGGGVNGVRNETHRLATSKKLATQYLDAYADLAAALRYAQKVIKPKQIVVWGSSYSASLVLRLAAENAAGVNAVLAFSPGEYFRSKDPAYVQSHAKRVTVPLFITSSKKERGQVKPIFDVSPSERKILFTPASLGQHGSRALWERWPDDDVYWAAVRGFLKEYVAPTGK